MEFYKNDPSFTIRYGTDLAIDYLDDLITLFKEQQVWEKRQILFQQALTRHTSTHWYRLLGLASRTDQLIKGLGTGQVWNALQTLSLEIAEPSSV